MARLEKNFKFNVLKYSNFFEVFEYYRLIEMIKSLNIIL